MFISVKLIVLACVLAPCANQICRSPRKRFCFKDTFVTPKKCNRDCPREHDDCEILEKSRFDSSEESCESNSSFLKSRFKDEDDEDDDDSDDTDDYNSKSVCSKRNQFPYKNERFIEESDIRSNKDCCRRSPQGSCYHYPNYSPMYMPLVLQPPLFYGLPCPYSLNYMYPPPNNLCSCERDFKRNMLPKIKNKRKCPKDPPSIYFYKKNDGRRPTLREIRNKPVSAMTSKEWKLLDEYLNGSSECSKSEEDDEDVYQCKPKPTPCSKRNLSSCRRKCSYKTTTAKSPETTTTRCRRRRSTKNTKCTKRPRCTTSKPLSTTTCKPIKCPTTTENCLCPEEKPRRTCTNDIVIAKVVTPVPCTDKPKNDSCSAVGDNIEFIKMNFDDLNKYCNCGNCKECCTQRKRKSDKDMDDLLRFHKCPVEAPKNPCKCCSGIYPRWYYASQPYFSCGCDIPGTEYSYGNRFDELYCPYTTYFEPLYPPGFNCRSYRRDEPYWGCRKRRRCCSKY